MPGTGGTSRTPRVRRLGAAHLVGGYMCRLLGGILKRAVIWVRSTNLIRQRKQNANIYASNGCQPGARRSWESGERQAPMGRDALHLSSDGRVRCSKQTRNGAIRGLTDRRREQ